MKQAIHALQRGEIADREIRGVITFGNLPEKKSLSFTRIGKDGLMAAILQDTEIGDRDRFVMNVEALQALQDWISKSILHYKSGRDYNLIDYEK